jgi:biotin-(acetyl-CoA carboxylase) ligase
MTEPELPPLLRGRAAPAGADPLALAAEAARSGVDPGLLLWCDDPARLAAALVLAPEMPLADAVGAVFAVALGFSDSLGALGPPETALHLAWPGRFKLNGGLCGRVRAAAPHSDPAAEPDWLVAGIEVALLPDSTAEPGTTPDRTTLQEEGCGDLGAIRLIESWSRHSIVWINRFVDDGLKPLHDAWRAKCDTIGKPVAEPVPGRFVGLDERGGMLLRLSDGSVRVLPLTDMLETGP